VVHRSVCEQRAMRDPERLTEGALAPVSRADARWKEGTSARRPGDRPVGPAWQWREHMENRTHMSAPFPPPNWAVHSRGVGPVGQFGPNRGSKLLYSFLLLFSFQIPNLKIQTQF
jgi:hypothetical protein